MNCILHHQEEASKAAQAAAAVLLGLMPSMLALFGSTTIETGLLALRRPFLATLLSAAAPMVSPLRSFDYHDSIRPVMWQAGSKSVPMTRGVRGGLVSLIQYAVGLAALANAVELTHELTYKAVFATGIHVNLFPLVFLTVGFAMHILGAAALFLKVRLVYEQQPDNLTGIQRMLRFLRQEFQPCVSHSAAAIALRRESYSLFFAAWLSSIGTVCFIIYGSYVFSSTQFIGQTDALMIVGRFTLSIVFCRIVLMYELSGMRQVVSTQDEGSRQLAQGATLNAPESDGKATFKQV